LTLTFDLRPIVDRTFPQAPGGLVSLLVLNRDENGEDVSHGSGFYRWGELNCSDRQSLAGAEASGALQQADRTCSTDDDCEWVSANTLCSQHCGAAVSSSGAGALAATLESISADVCGDFDADGCELPERAPCPEPPTVACIDSTCSAEP
jgi:hypothetical protein